MVSHLRCPRRAFVALLACFLCSSEASAAPKYDPGASDAEIKIGNIAPYSGSASSFATVPKVEAAYLRMLNDKGGSNGRKFKFISYDDAYSPPKSVEQVRKLVESDEVLLLFQTIGTAPNTAIQKYLNAKKVPQLFLNSGATKWGDPQHFPWTIGWQPSYQAEARIYAEFILTNFPNGKIGVIYQNDDFGKDYLKGLKDGLGERVSMISAEVPYDVNFPTIDSQIIQLKAAGVDIIVNASTPKFTAQTIKKIGEIGWTPTQIVSNVNASAIAALGVENSRGIFSTSYMKDPADHQWDDDPSMRAYLEFMDTYYPEGNKSDLGNVLGYIVAQALAKVIQQCGDDLTRENVMKQAANLQDFEIGLLLPGIKVNTSPTDFFPIKQLQLMRFDGRKWVLMGAPIGGAVHQ